MLRNLAFTCLGAIFFSSTGFSMNKTVLIPISEVGFDATEISVPWKYLSEAGIRVIFATPHGVMGRPDPLINDPKNFPLLFRKSFATNKDGLAAFKEMTQSEEFRHPISWSDISEIESQLDAIFIPGGHYSGEYGVGEKKVVDGTNGIRQLLESRELQKLIVKMHHEGKILSGICHGVLLLGRSIDPGTGKSILTNRTVTALPALSEKLAISATKKTLGRYYKTYDITVEDELRSIVGPKGSFRRGPLTLMKDSPQFLGLGFIVIDGNIITGRWQGDAHLMGWTLVKKLHE